MLGRGADDMKFRYKTYGSGILRPVITIELIHKGTEVPYEVLVDSGADVCIFDAQIAAILGIDITEGERHEIAGITGVSERTVVHHSCRISQRYGAVWLWRRGATRIL